MKHSKTFSVDEAYASFPVMRPTINRARKMGIAIRSVTAVYNNAYTRVIQYRLLVGEINPQTWTHEELKGWLSVNGELQKQAKKRKTYVDKVKEPLTVMWDVYVGDLNQMFNHASFDWLTKLGYPIWDDVDYDAEDVDGQYTVLLAHYRDLWTNLTPAERAEKLMAAGGLTEDQLATLCNEKEYEYFQ